MRSLCEWGMYKDEILWLDLLQMASHPVHKVPTYFFRMTHTASGSDVGRINLRAAVDRHICFHAGHVAYEVHPGSRGHRYASLSHPVIVFRLVMTNQTQRV